MQIQQEATSAAASLQRAEPIGVAAARAFAADPSIKPRTRIFEEFALTGRVGIVTGGVGGIGLETALCLCEAGARIYCLDLAPKPTQDFLDTQQFCRALGTVLEYISIDVTDQQAIWKVCEEIGTKEGRFDIAVCAAGILPPECDCLDAPAEPFERTNHVNVNGVFYSAQAAGRQMRRFGQGGSIVLIASMSGSVTNRGGNFAAYNISKSAVIQMARSMACELGPEQIRINSLSPGERTRCGDQCICSRCDRPYQNTHDQGRPGQGPRPSEALVVLKPYGSHRHDPRAEGRDGLAVERRLDLLHWLGVGHPNLFSDD
jgi:NAD(P)-dependent dehydrogenase (short-subunit alcohol dehydrogenase family)